MTKFQLGDRVKILPYTAYGEVTEVYPKDTYEPGYDVLFDVPVRGTTMRKPSNFPGFYFRESELEVAL